MRHTAHKVGLQSDGTLDCGFRFSIQHTAILHIDGTLDVYIRHLLYCTLHRMQGDGTLLRGSRLIVAHCQCNGPLCRRLPRSISAEFNILCHPLSTSIPKTCPAHFRVRPAPATAVKVHNVILCLLRTRATTAICGRSWRRPSRTSRTPSVASPRSSRACAASRARPRPRHFLPAAQRIHIYIYTHSRTA